MIFWKQIFVMVFSIIFALVIWGCKSDDEAKEPVAVMLTDWGTPEGFDYDYATNISLRSLIGLLHVNENCTDNYVGLPGFENPIGLLPPALVKDHSADQGEVDPILANMYDSLGVYKLDTASDIYQSILLDDDGQPLHTMIKAEVDQHGLEVIPMAESPNGDLPLTGRIVFTVNPRGDNYLEGYFQIELPEDNTLTGSRGNGLPDIRELSLAAAVRAIASGSRNTEPVENETVLFVEQRTSVLLEELFGDQIDVRAGKYTAFPGHTQTHEETAVEIVKDGFQRMLLTRETTDNNDYANVFMTRNFVDRGLCEYEQTTGQTLDMDIKQVRQVGRTPEYNGSMMKVIKPHLDVLDKGTEVAVIYTTYGLPWPGAHATEEDPFFIQAVRPPHPSTAEVYHENAYLNYLSFKRYAEAELGQDYDLVFTADATQSDLRVDNYFAYSMFGPQDMAVGAPVPPAVYEFGDPLDDPLRFLTVREQINRAKEAGQEHILVALSHWYYSSYLTTVNLRDINGIPYTSWEDMENGIFTVAWCEDENMNQLEQVPATGCPASHPFHMQMTETFDNGDLPEEFAVGYTHRIRGGLERFDLMPNLGISVSAKGTISKLEGGTVRVGRGELAGAALVVPSDPMPERPEINLPIDAENGTVDAINDPAVLADAGWFDFTAYIGTQEMGVETSMASVGTQASPQVLFGPYRTIFNKPAQVTLRYDSNVATTPGALRPFIYNEVRQDWDPVYPIAAGEGVIVDEASNTVSFDVQTLGIFALAVPSGDE